MIDLRISPQQFLDIHYETQFLVQRGAVAVGAVAWSDINSALFAWDPRDGLLQLFKDGPVPLEQYTEPFVDLAMQRSRIVKDRFYELMRNGATLILNRLEMRSEAVHDIAMDLARFVGEKTVANGYAAFGGEGTFAKHWDTHDVFAVQLIGRKRWRVFEPTFLLPLPQQKSKEHKHECPAHAVFDGVLEAGDVLYIPRGWWHEAVPLPGEETFHLAVGVHPMSIRDYISWSCFKTLPLDLSLRRSIKAESGAPPALQHAVQAAQAHLVDEANLAAFKAEVFASERVNSRFALESLGRPGGQVDASGDFRLNSAYRSVAGSAAKVHVNGQTITVDEASNAHLSPLFSQPRSTLAELAQSPAQTHRVHALLQQLAASDVIAPVRARPAAGLSALSGPASEVHHS